MMKLANIYRASSTEVAQASQKIPEKYAKLMQAEAAGVAVPMSLLLDFDEPPLVRLYAIDSFVECFPYRRFIVRSAHLSEDGGDFSLAGHFWSSGPVTEEQLSATIQQAQEENTSVLESLKLVEQSSDVLAPPRLVLQEYIEHEVGGVLFSPWSYYPDYVYVEHSETGVKHVVEGDRGMSSVLCLEAECPDPLPLTSEHGYLKQHLVDVCIKLRQTFDFPIDCEWVYEPQKQQIVVLQVRPQTHSVGPILPYTDLAKQPWALNEDGSQSETSRPQDTFTISQDWQFTALSESLGRLSFLSFTLLKQLYSDTIPLFRKLGCKAFCVDFMSLAPDGIVLIDVAREKQFYSMGLFGGFQRGKQQATFIQEANKILKQYDFAAPFSYERLQQLFDYWMGANLLSGGAGRCQSMTGAFADPVHAYELSWPAVLDPPVLTMDLESFEELNSWGRVLFLFELNKLKHQLKETGRLVSVGQLLENPEITQNKAYVYFCAWSELQASKIDHTGAELRPHKTGLGLYQRAKISQHIGASRAVYDYALSVQEGGAKFLCLSSKKLVEGVLQIITNPAASVDSIQTDCILVAPYFDNRWISRLKSVKGVVVNRGNHLSHSAIVAREYGIPYYVVPELNIKNLGQGQQITLDPNTVKVLLSD